MVLLKTVFTATTAETQQVGEISFIENVAWAFLRDKHLIIGVTRSVWFL